METMPKDSGGGDDGKSLDDIVKDLCNNYLGQMPPDFDIKDVRRQIEKIGGPSGLKHAGKPAKGLNVPLNVFLL